MPIEIAPPQEVEEYQDEDRPEVRGPWKPETLADVDWALSRLADCEAEKNEINRQASAAIQAAAEAIARRAEKLYRQSNRGIAYFTMVLAIWAEGNPDKIKQGQKKSRSFIHGSIGTRKKGGKLTVIDRDALVAWVRMKPPEDGLFRVKVEPEMKEIQKLYTTQGEVPPGCDVDPERDEIEIKAEQLTKAIQPAVKE